MDQDAAAALTARLQSIGLHYENVRKMGAAFGEAVADPRKCAQAVGLVTALSLGFFGARHGTRVLGMNGIALLVPR